MLRLFGRETTARSRHRAEAVNVSYGPDTPSSIELATSQASLSVVEPLYPVTRVVECVRTHHMTT